MRLEPEDNPLVTDLTTVPPGLYLVTVREVRVGQTRSGDERWALRLAVADTADAERGYAHRGRQAAWDTLVFGHRGRQRACRVLETLGFNVSKPLELQPDDLLGRTAIIEVRPVQIQDGDRTTIRNEVPYDGWRKAV